MTTAGRLEPQTPERETLGLLPDGQRGQRPAGRSPLMRGGAELPLQQPQLLVPAGDGQRLRDGHASDGGARHRTNAWRAAKLEPGFPGVRAGQGSRDPAQTAKVYAFIAAQPLRYLAFLVSRFARAETVTDRRSPNGRPTMTDGVPIAGLSYRTLNLSIEANPRQVGRGRDLAERAADIASSTSR